MYPGWSELPLARTNFNGPKPVRTIEILLYTVRIFFDFSPTVKGAPHEWVIKTSQP